VLIERGPDWNALIDIRITLARSSYVAVIGDDDDPQAEDTRH